jgi:hypothetical protein
MRWSRYSGERIVRPGWRTSISLPATLRFGPISRRYGCVWEDGSVHRGYYERAVTGQLLDIAVGPFASLAEAKVAVSAALEAEYPSRFRP